MQLTNSPAHWNGKEVNKHLDKTVFVIDDDEIILRVITQHLVDAGFEEPKIHGFTSPTEALEIIRFVKPNLILTDIHMPSLSGDCMAKLIQWPEFNKAPVIAVTGDDTFNLTSLPAQSGISEVVYKPIDSMNLLSTVFDVLEWTERKNEARESEQREKKELSNKEIQHQEEKLRKSFGKKPGN